MPENKPEISLDSKVAQSDDVYSAKVGSDIVWMRLESGAYYDSDEIGAEIWTLMATPTSVRALCARLMEIYDVLPERCHEDVLKFLRQALDEGMIRIV